jgi:alkanesulfonate monooxygenase SsuD/methylene tetrahydromethanopterin reductase-like flavin-dependent oxidoreductase (luciferase family)
MQFGLLYDFRNPPTANTPSPKLYGETFEQIRAAEALGWDSVWVTEHHFTDDGYLPSVDIAASAIAVQTERVRIGHSVLLLPLHHPIEVAENGAVLDIISNGRYIFGPGLGYKLDEFATFGVNRKHRPSRMDESMEIIHRAWSEERFSFAGRHFQVENIAVTPKPVQRPRPPIIMAARSEPALRRAARYADGIIAVGSDALISQYHDFVRAEGKDPATQTVAVLRSTIISDDPERTWAEVEPWVRWRNVRYGEWYGEAADLPGDAQMLPRAEGSPAERAMQALIRTPETLTADVRRLESIGVNLVIFFATFPGYAPLKMMPTWEAVARKVMPAFR